MIKIDPSTKLFIEEAEKRAIKVYRIGNSNNYRLQYKDHQDYLCGQSFSSFGMIARNCCDNKDATKTLLKEKGISIAEGKVFANDESKEALAYALEIGWPVVIKPLDSRSGRSVVVNIDSREMFESAFDDCAAQFTKILIERFHSGTEYRVLATREKVLGVINRIPANVVGDGHRSIVELIERKNQETARIHKKGLDLIPVDNVAVNCLKDQNLTLQSVPKENQKIFLRYNSNLCTGGDSIDCTDIIHPSAANLAVKAVNAIPGLQYGGVDLLTKDITKKHTPDSYIIIEVNCNPMITMHHFPYQGQSRDVASDILDLMFSETANR